MMTPPFLRGPNVSLRPLTPEDTSGPYLEWFNDAEVCAANGHHRYPFTAEQALVFIQEAQQFRDHLVLAIVANGDDRHIGNIALKRIDWIVRMAELAIVIGDKSTWGKGYSTEASRLLLGHAFFELNLNRVYCGTFESNQPMRRLAMSLGMKEEGCRREAAFRGSRYVSVVEYGVLRSEYVDGPHADVNEDGA